MTAFMDNLERLAVKPGRPFQIRKIRATDNESLAHIIRSVMPEFGAVGPGYAIEDPEVDNMYETYSGDRTAFYVVEFKSQVMGGAGIAPLAGAGHKICELRKMYFLKKLRGLGAGNELLRICLNTAREMNYTQCYLETLTHMDSAKTLYEKFDFKPLTQPMGSTGHFGCDAWYSLNL